jgi:thiol-disulfide isomerase/thioredoxin
MQNTKSILALLVLAALGAPLAEAKDTADAKPVDPAEEAAGPSKEDAANGEKFVKTPKPEKHAMLGKPAPEWEVGPWYQLPDGKESLDIADFKGKVLYMYCFQSWCPGCHSRGFPTLQKVSGKYKDDDEVKFAVFQTVFEDRADKPVNTFENLKKVARKFDLTMPFAQSGSREDKSKVMRAYKTRGTPWTVIVDRKGVIRYSGFHITPGEASKLIEELKAP